MARHYVFLWPAIMSSPGRELRPFRPVKRSVCRESRHYAAGSERKRVIEETDPLAVVAVSVFAADRLFRSGGASGGMATDPVSGPVRSSGDVLFPVPTGGQDFDPGGWGKSAQRTAGEAGD